MFQNSINFKILCSAFIFILVVLVLGIPYTGWWFNGCDDFHGLYLGFRTKTWGDLFYFFLDGHINQDIGPSNYLHLREQTTFLSTYYRPLYCFFATLQYWIFGTGAYWYHLCNVLFHALNSVILFNLFSLVTTTLPALLASLLFAFHPQIAFRFGALVNLHYYVAVFLMLLCVIFFKRYVDTNKKIFIVLASCAFAVALFTRESSIVLPAIITMGYALYITPAYPEYFSPRKMYRGVLKTAPLWAISFLFLALRLYLYPFAHSTTSSFKLATFLHAKSQELLVMLYDTFTLSWLPWGHPILRSTLLSFGLLCCLYLLIRNTKKLGGLACFASAALMLWPAVVGCYSPRYIYEAYPLILLGFIGLLRWNQGPLIKLKKLFLLLLSCYVLFLMVFAAQNFCRRQAKMTTVAHAVTTLVADPLIKNRPLCVLSYPADGMGDQPADIFKVMQNNLNAVVLCDTSGALVQADSNIVAPEGWRNMICRHYTKNYVNVSKTPKGFRFVSSNPEKTHFFLSSNSGYSLGEKIISQKDAHDRVTDFTLTMDKKYLDLNPIFIVWNYETKLFEVIAS